MAEVVALRGGEPYAPLSHYLRTNTRHLGQTRTGRVCLLAGSVWLYRHLYRPLADASLGASVKKEGKA